MGIDIYICIDRNFFYLAVKKGEERGVAFFLGLNVDGFTILVLNLKGQANHLIIFQKYPTFFFWWKKMTSKPNFYSLLPFSKLPLSAIFDMWDEDTYGNWVLFEHLSEY